MNPAFTFILAAPMMVYWLPRDALWFLAFVLLLVLTVVALNKILEVTARRMVKASKR